jgi:hypothetical protein
MLDFLFLGGKIEGSFCEKFYKSPIRLFIDGLEFLKLDTFNC